jgi:hypothetical protein
VPFGYAGLDSLRGEVSASEADWQVLWADEGCLSMKVGRLMCAVSSFDGCRLDGWIDFVDVDASRGVWWLRRVITQGVNLEPTEMEDE